MLKPEIETADIDLKTGTTLGFYHYGEERPNILILSAMEGNTAGCVYTSYLLMKAVEELGRIDGSMTFLPVANPLAFRLGAKASPLDAQSLDTVFPGSERGTVSERIAWEIWRRASQSDYIIHLRSGPRSCVSHVVALYRDYIHVRNLASQIGLPYVVQSSSHRGILCTEAAHDGIPAVTIEQRGLREQIDPQASVEIRESILNFLRLKDMIPGERIETSSVFTGNMLRVNSNSEGFFVPSVSLGDNISVDGAIGSVQGGGVITSPYEGIVLSLSGMNYVFEGDTIAGVASGLTEQPREDSDESSLRRKW